MRKEYFFVKPSRFARMGEINIDGDFEYVQFNDFKVNEPRENYIFFEVRYEYYENKKVYSSVAKEVVTGKPFKLEVRDRTSLRTGKPVPTAVLTNEELGLYSNVMGINRIECEKLSQLSAIFRHFQENPEDKEKYCMQLREMFEEAQSYKIEYDQLVDGPSRRLTSDLRRAYRRAK